MRKLIFVLSILWLTACSSGRTLSIPSPTAGDRPEITQGAAQAATLPAATPTPTPPPSWVGQGYTGRLILIQYGQKGNTLVELDLASGKMKTFVQAVESSWLAAAVVSPDHQQILLAYAPPPSDGQPNYGYSDFYLLPIMGDGSPKPFLMRKDPQESFFNPTWAADGKTIYYTHLYRMDPNSKVPAYQNDIEQVTLDGKTKQLVPHCLWPALSPDSKQLAYLNADPTTFGNDLYISNPDGSNPRPVLQPGAYPPVDDHFFSKDGSQIIFSMVNAQPAPARSWFDKLFGIQVASAHSVPSDWYIVTTAGGQPQRLTNLDDVGMYGVLSPDGKQMAYISATGLYIMKLDQSDLTPISDQVFIGTVDWIP